MSLILLFCTILRADAITNYMHQKAIHTPERPREKLSKFGPRFLSDAELLETVLQSGSKRTPVSQLAVTVLTLIDRLGDRLKLDDLISVRGIGYAKASLILAALELTRRRIKPHGVRIQKPEDVFPLVRHFADKAQEHFITVSLNGAHEVIASRCVTVGLVNCTQVHPREVFAEPITDRAAALVVAHNHPSGSLAASSNDLAVTRQLIDAGKILGIQLLDHIIFNGRGEFVSLRELGEGGFTGTFD